MAVSWLSRLAARAPVPVFIARGMHGDEAVHHLALAPGVQPVDSPRHAAVLLVAGGVPPELQQALRRVHDQLPAPFTTLWYRSEPLMELNRPDVSRVDSLSELIPALTDTYRKLLRREAGDSSRLLPDEPPNPWQGRGDNGHGGEGMMGGVPYGRPMAMPPTMDLRDGLALDILTFRLGPFFPLLPAGLGAEVSLQGDIVQAFSIQSRPFPQLLAPAFFATSIPIDRLELERARHHLQALFPALHLAGLTDLALDALRLAASCDAKDAKGIAALEKRFRTFERRLRGRGFFALHLPNRGVLSTEQAKRIGGFVVRAVGIGQDARSDDPEYRRLGFVPITHRGGDTQARWRQRLAEVAQSLALAGRASIADPRTDCLETPYGVLWDQSREDASTLLEALLPGLEWDQALATIASLELAAVSPWPTREKDAA